MKLPRLFRKRPPLHTPAVDVAIRRAQIRALFCRNRLKANPAEALLGSDYPRDDLAWQSDATFNDDMARSGEGKL